MKLGSGRSRTEERRNRGKTCSSHAAGIRTSPGINLPRTDCAFAWLRPAVDNQQSPDRANCGTRTIGEARPVFLLAQLRAVRWSNCIPAAHRAGHAVCADRVGAFSDEELSDAGGRDDCLSSAAQRSSLHLHRLDGPLI